MGCTQPVSCFVSMLSLSLIVKFYTKLSLGWYFHCVFTLLVMLCGCQATENPGPPLCLLPNRLDKDVEQGENAQNTCCATSVTQTEP